MSMDEKYYAENIGRIFAELDLCVWPANMDINAVAIAIMHEMAKDRRMAEVGAQYEERAEKRQTEPATDKQKAFIAKHCGNAAYGGTKAEASAIVEAKMREKGWGKYGK
jgi:hypothetical protein